MQNQILIDELKARQNVLLVGPPGCGKTARIMSVAGSCGYRTIVWRASLMERVDISGCIIPDAVAGISRQLPFLDVHMLQNSTEKTLLFIDDLGQAPGDVQAAIMRLFDGGFFPANVVIWAATNRPADKAGVTSLCEPLRSRFNSAYIIPTPGSADKSDGGVLLGDWKSEVEAWLDWAFSQNAPAEIISWIRFSESTGNHPLYQWQTSADPSVRMADYRSWGAMISRWNSGLRSLPAVSAVLGKPAASSVLAFASMMSDIPDFSAMCVDPDNAPVPTAPGAQWLVATAFASRVQAATCVPFLRYIVRLPRMLTALAARDAFKRLGGNLSGCREWVKWFGENQTLFS